MRQVQRNLFTNVLSLITNIIVGVIYVPYLVRTIGIAAYGIVPLTLIVNQYINVLTGSLSGALTRFYSIALQQHDYERASKCLSTIIGVFVLLTLILLPFLIFFISNVDDFLNIPLKFLVSAKLLFSFTIVSFLVSLFTSSLNVTLYAENRLDWLNWIKILRVGLKFLLAVFFFQLVGKEVYYIGIANLVTEVLVLILSAYLFRVSRKKGVVIRRSYFDRVLLASILGMALWTIIHQLGDVGIYRVDNIIVNNAFDIVYSGTLGAVSEFGVYVGLVVSVVGSLYGPLILKAYARGEHQEVQTLVVNNSLIVGTLSAILCGLLMGTSKNLLACWLGSSFVDYDQWLLLKLLPLPFYAAAGIYAFSNRVWNLVRYPAIITVIMGGINWGVLWLGAHYFQGRINNVVDIISLMLSFAALIVIAQSFILNASFFLKKYPERKCDVWKVFGKIVVVLIVSWIISSCGSRMLNPTNIFYLLLLYGILAIFLLSFMYWGVLNKEQKKSFMYLIKK